LIRLLNRAASGTVRRLGIEPQEELASVRTLEELELLIRSSGETGTLDPEAFTLLTRTLRFNDKTAADALVPRLAVVYVHPDDSIPTLIARSLETGFSRFPVCGSDLDDIVGVAHVKDVYRLPIERREDSTVADIMTEPFVVPETRDLASLLVELRTGSHLAVVVDEYGGTAGIITLEDVLEELVGEIRDENDEEQPEVEQEEGRRWWVSARLTLDELSELLEHDFRRESVSTVGGLIYDLLGRVPRAGEEIIIDNYRVVVERVVKRRVQRVYFERPDPTEFGAEPHQVERRVTPAGRRA
jgi:CBS domain containing-hemolysin-like protein